MGKEFIYEPENFFMVRNPLYSLNQYLSVYSNNNELNIEDIEKDHIFKESIKVSSKELSNALLRYYEKPNMNKKDKLITSLNKYYNRITTRPTPFGVFAAVGVGEFDEKTTVKMGNNDSYKKYAKVDSRWLFKIIEKLELEEELYKSIKLYSNNLTLVSGDKIVNPYPYKVPINTKGLPEEVYSINNLENVRIVLKACKEGSTLKEIYKEVEKRYTGISEEVVDTFVKMLLKKQFLLTELKPPMDGKDSLEYVILTLRKVNYQGIYLKKLEEIHESLLMYNRTSIGEGIELIEEISSLMEILNEASVYLQVDTASNHEITINNSIKEDLKDALKGLMYIINDKENSKIKDYMNRFIEKYGTNRIVPVKELLDEQLGLGSPYKNDKNDYNELDRNKHIQKYILNKVLKSVVEGKKDVIFTKEELKKFESKEIKEEDLYDSIEANIYLSAKSKDDIDKGEYELILGANIGSNGGGKTFGRFMNLLSDEDNKNLDKLILKNQNEDLLNVEITSYYEDDSSMNITNIRKVADYRLNLTREFKEDKYIDIDDVYIGMDNVDTFYAISKSMNKRLKFVTNHMLNSNYGNSVYRFLREIGEGNQFSPLEYFLGYGLTDLEYLPRIKVENLVIQSRTFRLFEENFNDELTKSFDKFLGEFNKWREIYNPNQYIFVTEFDNRILINLENQNHIRQLFYMLKNSENNGLLLHEFEGDINEIWSNSDNKNYMMELVIPLVKREKTSNKKSIEPKEILEVSSDYELNEFKSEKVEENRYFLPGGEWLYLKIYYNDKRLEELLGEKIRNLYEELKEENLVSYHFFIRYIDNGDHLRVRFKIAKESINIYKRINKWLNEQVNCGLINKAVIEGYEREIERYGGMETITKAEEYFAKESEVIEKFIDMKEKNEIEFDNIYFSICYMINIMENFNIEYIKQIDLLNMVVNPKDYRSEFNSKRKDLIKICNPEDAWRELCSTEEGRSIYNLILESNEAIKSYKDAIEEADKRGLLANSKDDIIHSLFHMFCNRLFGVDRDKEKKVLSFLRHTLYSQKYFRIERIKNKV